MPNRILKDSIKTSDQIDELSFFEEVVFYRLIVTADDYGCMDGRTTLLKNELFPTRDNVTRKAIESAIDKLASVGLLRKYAVNGKPYLCFPSWDKHQRIRNKHRKYPDPDLSDICQSNDRQMTVGCQSESESESESNMNPNNISAEQAHALVVARLPLNTGDYFEITEDHVSEWSKLYPAVDVKQAINDMLGWLNANPRKRKTKSGILNFCNSWLAKNQNRGGNTASAPASKWSTPEGPTRDDFERLLKMQEELKGGTR